MDTRTLSMPYSPTFSCDMEMYLWLLRNQNLRLVRYWWLGFEFAAEGRSIERLIWEIKNNPLPPDAEKASG